MSTRTPQTQAMIDEQIKFVNEWRALHGINPTSTLNDEQLTQFARDLQTQLANVSVRPENRGEFTFAADANPIPYSADIGETRGFKLAETINCSASQQRVYFAGCWGAQIISKSK